MGFLCAVATFYFSSDHCSALPVQKNPHAQKRIKLNNTLQKNTTSKHKLSSIFLGICFVSILLIFYFWNAKSNAENKEIDPQLKKDAARMKHEIETKGHSRYRIPK